MTSLAYTRALLKQYRRVAALIVLSGTMSGAFSAAVVALINHLLHPAEEGLIWLIVGFAGLVAGKVGASVLSQFWLIRFAQDAVINVTEELCRKLLGTSLRAIERAGASRILNTLTDDVGVVVWAAQCVPTLLMNGAMIAGCGAYLLWLSPPAFGGVLTVAGVGAVGYYWLHQRSLVAITAARTAKAQTFYQLQGLTHGIKELLMSAERRRSFFHGDLHRAVVELRRCNLDASRHHLLGESWTQSLYYFLIGVVLLAFPSVLRLQPEALTGFVFAMLYLMNPVWSVIGALPAVARGSVALTRIRELEQSLGAESSVPRLDETSNAPLESMCRIEMREVAFSYQGEEGTPSSFSLGPINFTVNPGELIFVVGGNGCGKSTFVKVLTGLYPASSGTIRIGRTPVTAANYAWYRQHFSAVFSDYHLFQRVCGTHNGAVAASVQHYLKLLEIDHKVSFSDGCFSTVDLSQGQRRRLALVSAYLEDRPIYVFDEWAADQDPHFKGIFYNQLLPDLCARGKAVLVVTHDDRYYHLGDKVVKLDEGMIGETWNPRQSHATQLES
jgi:putative ATP-binding cassette transporter